MEIVGGQTKVCNKCGEEKALGCFHVDRARRDGRKASCRICTNKVKARWRRRNFQRVLAQKKDSYRRNREKYRAYNRSDKRRKNVFRWKLERKFGITEKQFDDMLALQAGCCAICGCEPDEANGHRHKHRLCIDHDHKTGIVRGLLCTTCNGGLGYFRDDPERLLMAYEYLTNLASRQ